MKAVLASLLTALIIGTGLGCNETGNDDGDSNSSCATAASCMMDMCQVEIEQFEECDDGLGGGCSEYDDLLAARTTCFDSCDSDLTTAQREQAESQAIVCTIPEYGQENCDMRIMACANAG